MSLDAIGTMICRKPGWIVVIWLVAAGVVGGFSPDLTKLAAEGQAQDARLGAESRRAAELVKQSWPDEAYEAMAVAVLYRPAGLTEADQQFARRLSRRFEGRSVPAEVVRVLGPASIPEIAQRLVSRDGTVDAGGGLARHVVRRAGDAGGRRLDEATRPAPRSWPCRRAGAPLDGRRRDRPRLHGQRADLARPRGVATVVLLLIVLLAVYRSFWLALVPLATIGISLVIARGLLAWMILAGWEVSSLVELFLIAILFGTGTDFCLFLSWRYAEHFNREQSGRLDAGDARPVVHRRW